MVLDSKEMLLPANSGHHEGDALPAEPVSQSLKSLRKNTAPEGIDAGVAL